MGRPRGERSGGGGSGRQGFGKRGPGGWKGGDSGEGGQGIGEKRPKLNDFWSETPHSAQVISEGFSFFCFFFFLSLVSSILNLWMKL